MRALIFDGVEQIHCEKVSDPELHDPRDVILRVTHAAICGSDLHVYHGRERGLDHGTVMGHELIGEVVAVGKAVRSLRPGDRVVSPFTTSCGTCFYCRAGLTCRCVHGQLLGWVEGGEGLHGAQAEYARIPLAESSLLKLPEDVGDSEGILLGDVLPTGYFVASGAAIEPSGTYVVLGCGPVGLMAIVGARELGAERLYAVDRVPERLALARDFGAVPLDFARQDVVALIRESTEGRGADAVMEAVGSPAASELAYALVRPGGTISIAGVHNEPHFTITPSQAYDKNLTLKIGRCPARHLMEPLLALVRKRKLPFASIFSHRLPLADGAEGYRLFAARAKGCTKVLLET